MGTGRTINGEKTGIFMQVRLDSTRLPQKALLPLKGYTVIEHAMAGLKRVQADVYALVTDRKSASTLSKYAESWGFEVFSGPEEDVLLRYALAAERYSVSTILRATGDNPLVSSVLAQRILDLHLEEKADYSGFLGMPLGTGVEVINTGALKEARLEAEDPYEREHVSPFIYRREDRYRVLRPVVPEPYIFWDARVTLDTVEDYDIIKMIYRDLYDGHPIETDTVVQWLREHQHEKAAETVPT